MQKYLTNGEPWLDTAGNPIHAHGGWMLRHGGVWYWYGEDRRGNSYVSCYASADLLNWEFRGIALDTDSKCEPYRVRTKLELVNRGPFERPMEHAELAPPETRRFELPDGARKVNLERPKVIYNEKTGKFVMWVHYENGVDYHDAACAVATSDTPDGRFTFHGAFNPYGYMSRDCTLFVDDDARRTAYFVSAARDNADTHIYRLSEDYMNVESCVSRIFPGEYREAPAIVKRGGKYYMLNSFCTGWAPNQGKYSVSDSIDGRWSDLREIGDDTTYRSQPAFILTPDGESGDAIYVGDRWGGSAGYMKSTYIFLKLNFDGDRVSMDWNDSFTIRDGKYIAE